MGETSELCRAGEGSVSDGKRPIQQLTAAYPLAPFSQSYFLCRSNVPLFSVSLLQIVDFVYLFLILLVTQSFSPDTSLGLRLRLCPSHQMLICYSGSVWEPENELLADNGLLCTLHQTKDMGG